jgi:aryl-alcohol dehydrogenase-like predicted oxidoreductase
MEYRKLGATDLRLSAITHGAFAIGGTMWGGNERRDSVDSLRASLDNGVTTIDTAPFYGYGLSEELVGEAIEGRDRTKVQILTKFGLVWDGSNNGRGDFFFDTENAGRPVKIYKYASRANVTKELEESLRRLGTDYVDLLQLHWPDSSTPIDETMEALERLVEQGKIRAAGVSNYSVGQLREAVETTTVASNQVSYSMLNRAIEKDLVPYSREHNVGIIAYSPLERGLLTGKYFSGAKLKNDDHRHGYFGQFDAAKVGRLLDALRPVAEKHGSTLSQLVLRWTTMQPGITVVLAGARNAAQAVENAGAAAIALSQQEVASIDAELGKI